ncbi:1-deoxy-D-xylulose-5-phosphate synthase [Striga asiatica]|uniref:1-deoxy-D-xylulose-5-phosphate synthase n=1 Tax=Striga asiatica TaxID=4170 RepID=A0A5A7PGD1_STRAF|nr:1-deoxy-D-xylulose-5-phosphate synthase [Striga asiatica]
MMKQMLGCCKIYISESRNKAALDSIERAAKLFSDAPIVNKFEDAIYNRVGYTLVSDPAPLKGAAFEMVRAALEAIDLERHCGSHPRLGVVDHVCFFPLGGGSLERVAGAAKSLGADVGSRLHVATFLYGAAHREARSLDSIRRELGYFKPNADGNQWTGGPHSEALQLSPDEGPSRAIPKKGVIVIGATRWVDNYNVPIFTTDMAKVRKIARRVRKPSVQSMALAHGKGIIEIACNLLDTSDVDGDFVQKEVERLAGEEGLVVGEGYYTDLSQEKLVEKYLNLVNRSFD